MSKPGNPPVLVVDDDPALRAMLQVLLQAQGYVVVLADDRASALRALDEHQPGVLLLDLGLPPAAHAPDEGLAVLDAASERAAKVIVLTGQDGQASALAAIGRGAFDFLAKPVAPQRILDAVDRALVFMRNEALLRESGDIRLTVHAPPGKALREIRDEAELRLLRQVLDATAFNVHETARRLGVKREQVYYLLNKHGISRPADAGAGDGGADDSDTP